MAATSPRKPRMTTGRHRKPSNSQASNGAHWLRVGAVGIGVAAAIAGGQGIASATPDDSSNSAPSAETQRTEAVRTGRASNPTTPRSPPGGTRPPRTRPARMPTTTPRRLTIARTRPATSTAHPDNGASDRPEQVWVETTARVDSAGRAASEGYSG